MQRQLDRIINLVKKTGDRMVVLDRNNPRKSYVVMDINEYERLVDCCRISDWGEDDEEDYLEGEDYNYKDGRWDDDEEDEDWEFKPEDIFNDKEKKDEFNGLPADNEPDFNEPPVIDYPEDGANDDFTPIDEILADKQEQLDRSEEYGKIKQNYSKTSNLGRKRWEIAPEVKNTGVPEELNKAEEEEDERYYLETI